MKKQKYKRLKDKLYKEIKRRSFAESRLYTAGMRAIKAEEEARYYKTRFRAFGSNVETVEPDDSKDLRVLKWELKPEIYGNYLKIDDELIDPGYLEKKVAEELAKGLVERNLVQFIKKDPDNTDPLNRYGTFAAKIYVVPWEQVPHKQIIELKQLSDEILHLQSHAPEG